MNRGTITTQFATMVPETEKAAVLQALSQADALHPAQRAQFTAKIKSLPVIKIGSVSVGPVARAYLEMVLERGA